MGTHILCFDRKTSRTASQNTQGECNFNGKYKRVEPVFLTAILLGLTGFGPGEVFLK